jgi:hypothetical protein
MTDMDREVVNRFYKEFWSRIEAVVDASILSVLRISGIGFCLYLYYQIPLTVY